jgi:hypothetical protein
LRDAMKSAGRSRLCRTLGLAATCLLLAAGCRDSGATGGDDPTTSAPETTLPAETTVATTATTAPIPLDQDPPVIDLAYTQRVLNEISRLDGEVSRILYRDRALTPEYEATITSFLHGGALEDARTGIQSDLSVGFASYRNPPGDPVVTALRLLSSRKGCIAVEATSDFGPRYKSPVEVEKIVIVLQRNRKPSAGASIRNPSNWVQSFGGPPDGQTLEDICK